MKVLFLDIDGVMVTDKIRSEDRNNKWDVDIFDPICVPILNDILKITDCEIIISSDWRYHHSITELQEIFLFNNIIKLPIAITPKHKTNAMLLEFSRNNEIKEWLELSNRTFKIDKFVVIDDYDLRKYFPNNVVWCRDTMKGISAKGIKEEIIKILL